MAFILFVVGFCIVEAINPDIIYELIYEDRWLMPIICAYSIIFDVLTLLKDKREDS